MVLQLLSSYGLLASWRIPKKADEQIPRKRCYGQTNGQTHRWWLDGQVDG